MRGKLVRWCLGVAAIVIVGGFVVVRFDQAAPLQSHVLPDGSVVILRGVTYGTRHQILEGSLWQRTAARLLPEKLARRFRIPQFIRTTTNETAVVWVELKSSPTSASFGPSSLSVSTSDDEGTGFAAGYVRTGPVYRMQSGPSEISACVLPAVPRGKLLKINLIVEQLAMSRHFASFSVDNPAPRLRNGWKAQPFPITSRVDRLQFVLKDVRSFNMKAWPGDPPWPQTWTRADYDFYEGEALSTNWQVRRVEVFDGAGQYDPPSAMRLSSDPKSGRITFRGGISTQSVWKLRFGFCQVAGWPADETWIARDIPIRGMDWARFRPMTNHFSSATVVLYDVATGLSRSLKTYVLPVDEGRVVTLLHAIDNNGMRIDHEADGRTFLFGVKMANQFDFPLKPTPQSSSVDATFGVSQLKYVEVLVTPSSGDKASIFPEQPK